MMSPEVVKSVKSERTFHLFLIAIKPTMAFKFEKLIVWQKAVDLSDPINQLAKKFPKDELYILVSQIKGAADSISLNIADGSTGQSNAEFGRFIGISIRSDIEFAGCIFLAKRRGYINNDEFEKIYKMCEEILVMLNFLRNSLNKEN